MKIDLSDLLNNIDTDLKLTEQLVEKVCEETTGTVHDVAKDATPVRTGTLKTGWKKGRVDESTWVVENDVPYASYVNDGTSKQQGQHMVEKAIDAATRLK